MEHEVLVDMLKNAAQLTNKKPTKDAIAFSADQEAALIVNTDGTMSSVVGVRSIELRKDFLMVSTAKNGTLLLDASTVVGIRVNPGRREGPGF